MANKNRGFNKPNRSQNISAPANLIDDNPIEKDPFEDGVEGADGNQGDPDGMATVTTDVPPGGQDSLGVEGEAGPVGPDGFNNESNPVTEEDDQRDEPTRTEEDEVDDTILVDEREGEDNPANDQSNDEDVPELGAEQADEDFGTDLSVDEDVPTFPFTEINTWTTDELALYISRPENMDIYHSKLVLAIDEHRRRETTLNEAWSVDECTEFFQQGVEPKRTTSGCYVKDVTRKLRREGSWTTQELEAWAQGEIQPEGMVTTGGLAVELHSRFHMPINSVAVDDVIAHYKYNYGPNKGQVTRTGLIPVAKAVQPSAEEVKVIEQKIKYAGLTEMSQAYIEDTLKEYADAVRPNRIITPAAGESAQRTLDTVMQHILKQEDPVAVKSGLDILFAFVHKERVENPRGVFSDTNALRFATGVPAIARAQEIHRRLLTLIFTFVDGDEGILAQTDIPELLAYLPARQQSLLLSYLQQR